LAAASKLTTAKSKIFNPHHKQENTMSDPIESPAPAALPADLPDPIEYGPDTIEGRAIELMKAADMNFYITREGIPSYPNEKAFNAVVAGLEIADGAKGDLAGEVRRGDALERELAVAKNRTTNLFTTLKVIQWRYAVLISDLGSTEENKIDTSGDYLASETARLVLSGDTWAEASVKAMAPSTPRY